MHHHEGELIHVRYSPGIIVGSYFVSLCGAYATVELLHLRSSGKSWRKWAHLAACAVCFGLFAIWCMHFVGNSAIILDQGQIYMQLNYAAKYTVASAIVPCVVLFVGFCIVDRYNDHGKRQFHYAVGVCSVMAGMAIAGMHYIGNLGTTNYKHHHEWGTVLGAIIIASTACWLSLALFYTWRKIWINVWWRRLACAAVLAMAVSAMHWVAAIGTKYELLKMEEGTGLDRHMNLIVASSMSAVACLIICCIALYLNKRRKIMADRAQHVTLASATFDSEGRILVTEQGQLPCHKITRKFNQRSFDDEFNVSHPVYQWLYRASYDWNTVIPLIPAMKAHLRKIGASTDAPRASLGGIATGSVDWDSGDEHVDYSVMFRELFCVAASNLADYLKCTIGELGTLYEEITMSGISNPKPMSAMSSGFRLLKKRVADAESGREHMEPVMFGAGQILFLVRQIDDREATRLIDLGFRFAEVAQVGEVIAKGIQVPVVTMTETINRLRAFPGKDSTIPVPGTYLSCFCIRPIISKRTGVWEVLVTDSQRGRLPMVKVKERPLEDWQMNFIKGMEGMTVNQILTAIQAHKSTANSHSFLQWVFLWENRINQLADVVPEPFFQNAFLSSDLLPAYGQIRDLGMDSKVNILAFCIIPDIHSSSLQISQKLTYIPLTFFLARQRVYENAPDHAKFAKQVFSELGGVMPFASGPATEKGFPASTEVKNRKDSITSFTSKVSSSGFWPFRKRSVPDEEDPPTSDKDSERELVVRPRHAFGGIMVNSIVNIDGAAMTDQMTLGTYAVASADSLADKPTFADTLVTQTKTRWQKGGMKSGH
ncbi:hypothetical protein M501DRAFT_971220 [Patellaria atrata CBS 101060]|uniref:MHYT domain-containing protein n=1 Tax=Patellaria atrata CBS 101060 TaxID=1346257 RepID=A0A9P4SFG9_9PEZI|nr:hypothetical protein M501DRAFT_971220 [Patellaria atrata CBS 101060]